MAAYELIEDLHISPSALSGMLVEMVRRGAIVRRRSTRIEGGGFLYALPGGWREGAGIGDKVEMYTGRNYGMIYSGEPVD